MNFARLGYVAGAPPVGEHREAILAVTIPERPGAFLAFCAALGPRNVTEFNYRLSSRAEAHVFAGVEVANADEARALVAELERAGHACIDLSSDDIAKTHIRHMVGGRRPKSATRCSTTSSSPSARARCSSSSPCSGAGWNMSLPLPGPRRRVRPRAVRLEVPPAERGGASARLDGLGFSYVEATDKPAGRFFLR